MKTNWLCVSGQGSSPDSELVGMFASKMADEGWAIASRSNLKPTMVPTSAGKRAEGRLVLTTCITPVLFQ